MIGRKLHLLELIRAKKNSKKKTCNLFSCPSCHCHFLFSAVGGCTRNNFCSGRLLVPPPQFATRHPSGFAEGTSRGRRREPEHFTQEVVPLLRVFLDQVLHVYQSRHFKKSEADGDNKRKKKKCHAIIPPYAIRQAEQASERRERENRTSCTPRGITAIVLRGLS